MSEATTNQAAQEALPFLVEKGLAKLCVKCPEAKKLVWELNRLRKDVSLTADSIYIDANEGKRHEVEVTGPLSMTCPHCHDTGIVPTVHGWQLIGLVKRFIEQASGSDLGKKQEIPF